MWVFMVDGFLSIVQHNAMPDHFQVKSRVPGPLESLWPDHEVEVIDGADYRYRITIEKPEVLPILLEVIASVDYTSFKDACSHDANYRLALSSVWQVMYSFQEHSELG